MKKLNFCILVLIYMFITSVMSAKEYDFTSLLGLARSPLPNLNSQDDWKVTAGEVRVASGSQSLFHGNNWIVLNGWASRSFASISDILASSNGAAIEVDLRISQGRSAMVGVGIDSNNDGRLLYEESAFIFGIASGGNAFIQTAGSGSVQGALRKSIDLPDNEMLTMRIELTPSGSEGLLATLKKRNSETSEWEVIEGLENIGLNLSIMGEFSNPASWRTVTIAGSSNGGIGGLRFFDLSTTPNINMSARPGQVRDLVLEGSSGKENKTVISYADGGILTTLPGEPFIIDLPNAPFKVSFEALVSEVGNEKPDFNTPQIWFSADYLNPFNQLAFSIRGGRLQDIAHFRLAQAGWTGPVSGNWRGPENAAIRASYRRLANIYSPQPISEGKWISVKMHVGNESVAVDVDGENVFTVGRALMTGDIALGGSWQTNQFRQILINELPESAEPPKLFAPRSDFHPSALKVNFGPSLPDMKDEWKEPNLSGGISWISDPQGLRNRGRDNRIASHIQTVAVWAHEKRHGLLSIEMPEGEYLVTIATGDLSFPSRLKVGVVGHQNFMSSTVAGEFKEVRMPVIHRGGALKVQFDGSAGAGGASPYLVIEPIEAREGLAMTRGAGITWNSDSQAVLSRRVDLTDFELPELDNNSDTVNLDLSGNWLFMPYQDIDPSDAINPDVIDNNWHVISVPDFWNPIAWWIFGQGDRKVSHAFLYTELDRLANLTFDWRNTSQAWYRIHLDIPESWKGRRVLIDFEGVATVCTIYVNGQRAGGNVGMFRPFSVDLTPYIKPGQRNILTMQVSNGERGVAEIAGSGDGIADEEIAVTMVVTREMATQLPRGIYTQPHGEDGSFLVTRQGGIWLPAKLRVTSPLAFADVYPVANESQLKIAASTTGRTAEDNAEVLVVASLQDMDGTVVITESHPWAYGEEFNWDWNDLEVKRWSPENPNLYKLKLQLISADGRELDHRVKNLGFRTFEIVDGEFHLNGNPWRFLGTNMPPHGLRPNDFELAQKFMGLMREGNQRSVRTVCSPFPELWLDEADRQGIAVSYEGTWPWVLIGGQPIPDELALKAWKEEWIALVKKHRHRPSIVMWTIGNENYLVFDPDVERRAKKWEIWQEMMEATREADPTRPIVTWSGYTRKAMSSGWRSLGGGDDDGDIDDRHTYGGTYSPSPLGSFAYWPNMLNTNKTEGRPFISQEAATAYANTDLGHQELSYLGTWHGQTWTGDQSYPWNSPAFFLNRTARTTKEQIELARRENIQGWLAFCNATWYNNVDQAGMINPYPAHDAVRMALEPSLVSLLRPPHRIDKLAESIPLVISVINDSEKQNPRDYVVRLRLIGSNGKVFGEVDGIPFSQISPGGGKQSKELLLPVSIGLLEHNERISGKFELKLMEANGANISYNYYDVDVIEVKPSFNSKIPAVGSQSKIRKWNTNTRISGIELQQSTIRSAGDKFIALAPREEDWTDLIASARKGAKVMVLHPESLPSGKEWGGVEIKEAILEGQLQGEVANITYYGRKIGLAKGLHYTDMSWWPGHERGRVLYDHAMIFRKPLGEGIKPWVNHSPTHGYDTNWRMYFPVVEFPIGDGVIIVSLLNFDRMSEDPAPRMLWQNMIKALLK